MLRLMSLRNRSIILEACQDHDQISSHRECLLSQYLFALYSFICLYILLLRLYNKVTKVERISVLVIRGRSFNCYSKLAEVCLT